MFWLHLFTLTDTAKGGADALFQSVALLLDLIGIGHQPTGIKLRSVGELQLTEPEALARETFQEVSLADASSSVGAYILNV